jgi:hypothetical protein
LIIMYKQTLIPDKKNHSVEMPERFYGKKVEVIVIEIGEPLTGITPVLPQGKKIDVNELFENFGAAPDFSSAEELRAKVWPSKW